MAPDSWVGVPLSICVSRCFQRSTATGPDLAFLVQVVELRTLRSVLGAVRASAAFEQRLAYEHAWGGILFQLRQQPDQQTQNSFICSWFLSLGYTGQHLSSDTAYFQMSDNFQNRK